MSRSAERCPLCGQPNRCTQADPAYAHLPCWCFSAKIDRAALERLPESARGIACLCPNCARAVHASAPQTPNR